jgi:hypothetical protein
VWLIHVCICIYICNYIIYWIVYLWEGDGEGLSSECRLVHIDPSRRVVDTCICVYVIINVSILYIESCTCEKETGRDSPVSADWSTSIRPAVWLMIQSAGTALPAPNDTRSPGTITWKEREKDYRASIRWQNLNRGREREIHQYTHITPRPQIHQITRNYNMKRKKGNRASVP